ncbi:MAG: lytic transglycosylase domain-containing protein [Hydrogenophaga sp.]
MKPTEHSAMKRTRSLTPPLRTALGDIAKGCAALTHNGMALTGMALLMAVIALIARPDLRQQGEQQLLAWLQERQTPEMVAAQEPAIPSEPDAAERATALLPDALPKQQADVAHWLSRKYRVAPEPLSVLVAEAFDVGERVRLDPTLLLAVMAVESRFNPFAQSPVGAQGLMQVLTRVHTDKYEPFGGQLAAFDPVTNLRVGARILHDCVKRAGSIEGGLRLYVGAVTTDGSGYINKVMAEHLRIQSVALGKPMPSVFPIYRPEPPAEITPEPILDTASVMDELPERIPATAQPADLVKVDEAVTPKAETNTEAPLRS